MVYSILVLCLYYFDLKIHVYEVRSEKQFKGTSIGRVSDLKKPHLETGIINI